MHIKKMKKEQDKDIGHVSTALSFFLGLWADENALSIVSRKLGFLTVQLEEYD